MYRLRTVHISINHIFKYLVLSKNVKKKETEVLMQPLSLSLKYKLLTSLETTIKVTYKLHFCLVPQEPN